MRPIPREPCLALVHAFEGFSATPYKDPVGLWTIGYGHRIIGDPLLFQPPWTQAQADDQALVDLGTAATGVSEALGEVVNKLTEGQYAACIDFAYNVGVGAFTGSTLCHFILTGNMQGVPAQFMLWVHGRVNGVETVLPGLVRRRQAEVDVWRT